MNQEINTLHHSYNYDELFENGFDGILTFDVKQVAIVDVNQKLLEYFKVSSKAEFLERGALGFSPEFQPSGDSSEKTLNQIMEKSRNEDEFRFNWLHQLDDGSLLYTDVFTFRNKQQPHLFTSIFRDVTHEKQQEQLIKQQLRELDQKNKELRRYSDSNTHLENFAYIASHDLKSPMRSMISFSQLLKKSAGDKLSTKEHEYLEYIVSSTKNMQQIIDDLLAYSIVDARRGKASLTNIPRLIDDVLFGKKEKIQEKNADIILINLPFHIQVDKAQFKQLFDNLIDNALKFSKNNEPLIIEIQCEESDEKWLFSIKDNGIGISNKYFEDIFLIFKKIHPTTEYSGTGIGLATCKKIITQHGGDIWLESEVGTGSKFCFTIPKKQIHE